MIRDLTTACTSCGHEYGDHRYQLPHGCTSTGCKCSAFEQPPRPARNVAGRSGTEAWAEQPPQLASPEVDEPEAVADWRRAIVRAWDEASPRAAMRIIGPAGHRLAAALIDATRRLKEAEVAK